MGKFLKQYEVLFKKAKVDLNMAKLALDAFEKGEIELDLEVIMFHIQQSAEKLLKSLLSYNEMNFTKTHDIKQLIYALKDKNITMLENIEEFIPLTYYAVDGRYAVIHDDMEDVKKYIELLETFKEFVRVTLKLGC